MALTRAKLEELIDNGDIDVGGGLMSYPIGSIYMSVSSTSPATLFGGTWAALGGRMLIGADGTYTAGETGGAATHTLSISEMPTHNHQIMAHVGGGGDYLSVSGEPNKGWQYTPKTRDTGLSHPHNNMPPYLAVYMWKRTA